MIRPKFKLCPACSRLVPTVEVNLSDHRISETHYRIGNHGRANRKGPDVWKNKCPGSGKQYPIPRQVLAEDAILARMTEFRRVAA